MELPEQAARALEAVRSEGRELRFEVDEICHSKRFRLSVRYVRRAGDSFRLGLLYAEDRAALERLASVLASRIAASP